MDVRGSQLRSSLPLQRLAPYCFLLCDAGDENGARALECVWSYARALWICKRLDDSSLTWLTRGWGRLCHGLGLLRVARRQSSLWRASAVLDVPPPSPPQCRRGQLGASADSSPCA